MASGWRFRGASRAATKWCLQNRGPLPALEQLHQLEGELERDTHPAPGDKLYAPSILGHKGLLDGREATCFPGFEEQLTGARLSESYVCRPAAHTDRPDLQLRTPQNVHCGQSLDLLKAIRKEYITGTTPTQKPGHSAPMAGRPISVWYWIKQQGPWPPFWAAGEIGQAFRNASPQVREDRKGVYRDDSAQKSIAA